MEKISGLLERGRLQTAARNFRSAPIWRPAELTNLHRLVTPLRGLHKDRSSLEFYHLLFELFTKVPFEYRTMAPALGPAIRHGVGVNHASQKPAHFRLGVFVDAPSHVSGVATTLASWSATARAETRDLEILSCGGQPACSLSTTFRSIGSLQTAAYSGMDMQIPDVRSVLAYVRKRNFSAVHLSTPGPMGFLGLIAAAEFRLPVFGTYHTDFPGYAARLLDNPSIESFAWDLMRWFYGKMARISVPSKATLEELVEHGFDASRLEVVGRGVDHALFNPSRRSERRRAELSFKQPIKLLYVGRVSEEKNLSCLAEAFRALCRTRRDCCLIIVGEGPFEQELQQRLAGLPVIFTGYREGADLAELYASSDIFVFPSETDTLGVVCLEAQASGLPLVVSSKGGPAHTVVPGRTGVILEEMSPPNLAYVIGQLIDESGQLERMSALAVRHAAQFTHAESFHAFWNLHRETFNEARRSAAGFIPSDS